MEFSITALSPETAKTGCVVVGVHLNGELTAAARRVDQASKGALKKALRDLSGKTGSTLLLHSLPGVARASFGSGQLVVWGAAPNDTRIDVDGVEVPALYHLGGVRSVVSADRPPLLLSPEQQRRRRRGKKRSRHAAMNGVPTRQTIRPRELRRRPM